MAEGTKAKARKACGIYKLFWIFLLWSIVGDFVETVFCRITMGVWMSRSSLVLGRFSVVWGIGAVILTASLYRLRSRGRFALFLGGALLGGFYEYMCSLMAELIWGVTFWDYSALPLNIQGRINLPYCMLWGLVAVIWVGKLYPVLSGLIDRFPLRGGRVLGGVLAVFMLLNMALSAAALLRSVQRRNYGEEMTVKNRYEEFLDTYFPDERLQEIYPKMKQAGVVK